MGNGNVKGSSGGSICSVDYMEPKHSGIISFRLLAASRVLAQNEDLRKRFSAFLMSMTWIQEYLDGYGNDAKSFMASWYQFPPGKIIEPSKGRCCLNQIASSLPSPKSSHSSYSASSTISRRRYLKPQHSLQSLPQQLNFVGLHSLIINSSSLATSSHLPILIISAVLPIFFVSPEFKTILEEIFGHFSASPIPRKLKEDLSLLLEPTNVSNPFNSSNSKNNNKNSKKDPPFPTNPSLSFTNLHQEKIVEENDDDLEADALNKDVTSTTLHSNSITQRPIYQELFISNSSSDTTAEMVTVDKCPNPHPLTPVLIANKEELGTLEDAVTQAIKNISIAALDKTLHSSTWLRDFVSFLEDLPFCITVASATCKSVDGSDFPLIYVNEAFECVTQYSRSEVIGRNCRFLQHPAHTEAVQIELLRTALRERQGVKVALTNVRKDGSVFFNFLAMKPVYNRFGEFTHVIGVQYPLEGHEDTFSEDLVAVNDLMRLLPSVLY